MWTAIGAILGGVVGYILSGVCTTGTCPILKSPYLSTAYGIIMGIIISIALRSK